MNHEHREKILKKVKKNLELEKRSIGIPKFSHQKQNTNQIRIKLNNAAHQSWKIHKVEMSLGNQDFQTGITIDHG